MKSLSLKLTRSHLVQVLAIVAGLFAVGLWQPSAAADGARVVKYGKEDIVPVHAKLRFSTLIVLPEGEVEMLGPEPRRRHAAGDGRRRGWHCRHA